MTNTKPEVTTTAWATTASNTLGADAGVTVFRQVTEDGVLVKSDEIAAEAGGPLEAEGDPDYDAMDELLAALGYSRTEPWTLSGGQYAAQVEHRQP